MRITTRKELKEILAIEKSIYCPTNLKAKIFDKYTDYNYNAIFKYIKLLRKTEYYRTKKEKAKIWNIMYMPLLRKKNRYGYKLGFEIGENVFEPGVCIFHTGSIIVNGESRVGRNCKLHGHNCIGNKGSVNKAPQIGDNVDIGVGACILGDIKIANDIVVAAGAVVVDSFLEEGITIGGIPARKIK